MSSLVIATASAVAYVTLQWTTAATVEGNPKACFIKWADGTKANTFTYNVNIFPNVKTVDENITYGIWNNDTSTRTVYFRLASENTNSTDVTSLNYTVYNGGQLYTYLENDFDNPSLDWSSGVQLAANTKYTIWMEIQCANTAGIGHTPQFTFEMKVENP
jgi:Zn-dependent metalloprotease